eukprot:4080864-Pyramimonas_sp.AAC.1
MVQPVEQAGGLQGEGAKPGSAAGDPRRAPHRALRPQEEAEAPPHPRGGGGGSGGGREGRASQEDPRHQGEGRPQE